MQKKTWAGWKKLAVKAGGCLAAVSVLAAGWGGLSYGATESSVIETLTITFEAEFGEPEEVPMPEVKVQMEGSDSGRCDVEYRTQYDNWKPGKKVRAEVAVYAEDGKVFPTTLNRNKCKVTGADFVSAKALDDTTLQVKVDYRPITVLGDTTQAGWTASRKRATWKAVDYAPGYSLVLYGDDKVVKRLTVQGATSVDLTEFMDDVDKTYYYEVKAVPITSDQKKYLKEGEFVTSTDQEFDWEDWDRTSSSGSGSSSTGGPGSSGGAGAGDGGSIKGDNYIMPDGRKETNTWKKISGNWYYFDQNGNMARGWQSVGSFWYFMNSDGIMQSGWVNPSGDSWFYLNPNGDISTGWIQPHPGQWYYLNQWGYMERDWVLIGDKWYYMDASGRMQTGWVQVRDKWYYLYSDGSMAANTQISGRTLGADGAEIR